MSNWVEYCNLENEGYYAKWRIRNGYEKPHKVKYWSIGNENYGFWEIGAKSAEEWGRLVKESAKMIKHVDPDGNQPQSRPTRPVRRGYRNGGRPNPYAFYPRQMRPQSYTQKTSMTYRGNGTRQIVAMEPPTILHTVNTPGGNEVQMSGNNKWGTLLSGMLDLSDKYKEYKDLLVSLVTTVNYGESGIVNNKTEIVIDDPQLAMLQLEYEAQAREIEKSLGEVDIKGKSMMEIIEILAERKKMIEDKIGLSPKAVMETMFYLYPERFQPGATVRQTLPEFIQHH